MLSVHPQSAWRCTLATGLALVLSACGGGSESDERREYPITVEQTPQVDDNNPPVLTTAQRMGLPPVETPAPPPPAAASAVPEQPPAAPEQPLATGSAAGLSWETPAGWEPQPGSRMRVANFRVGGDETAECFLTVLPGTAGGTLSNINRWLAQIGGAPIDEAGLEALQRVSMLGGEAYVVSATGTFTGMRNSANIPDAMLVGAALVQPDSSYFVKMTGPRSVVAPQMDAFLAFCSSLRADAEPPAADEAANDEPEPEPAAPEAPVESAPAVDPAALRWDAPEGWERGADRMMRLVTYTKGDAELYVTSLAGTGGGVVANINRWAGQMGQPSLTGAEIDALPTVSILGIDAPFVQSRGDFTGMRGDTIPDQMLLGAVAPLDGQTIFVKLTGPAAEVEGYVEAFQQFCASMRVSE